MFIFTYVQGAKRYICDVHSDSTTSAPESRRQGEPPMDWRKGEGGSAGVEQQLEDGSEVYEITTLDWATAIYFVSFVFVGSIIAINIVVSVMFEGFLSTLEAKDCAERIEKEAEQHHRVAGPLDPVLASLANFSSPSHLKSQIELLFQLFDVDDSGAVSHEEMRLGLGKLCYYPCIVMSSEDWETFTFHRQLLDEDGCLSPESFDVAMRSETESYFRYE